MWKAILRHNLRTDHALDIVCVGESSELPLGISDLEILQWAERKQRILVTQDRRTMPAHLQHHLDSGHHSPGILTVHRNSSIRELLEILILIDQAGENADFADAVNYIPY